MTQTTDTPPAPPTTQADIVLMRVVWAVALLGMLVFGAETFWSFELQTSAPQQGAVAAWGAFRVILVYVLARSMEGLIRPSRG